MPGGPTPPLARAIREYARSRIAGRSDGSEPAWTRREVLRMGGILEINEQNLALGPGYPVFSLKADYAVQ